MKKIIIPLLSLFLMTQLTSCIGYSVKSASSPFPKYEHRKKGSPKKGWENIIIYDGLDESDKYTEIAKLVVTGNASSSEEKLLNKLRKEAGKYHADAILHIETREVFRNSFNGISAGLNLASIFVGDGAYLELNMGGEYSTLEVEAIAIRFEKD